MCVEDELDGEGKDIGVKLFVKTRPARWGGGLGWWGVVGRVGVGLGHW